MSSPVSAESASTGQTAETASAERIRKLLARHPLVDGHNDLPWEAREQAAYDLDVLDLAAPVATTCTDLPRLRAGGVGGQFWSVFVPGTLPDEQAVAATLEQIAFVREMTTRYAADLTPARSAADVVRAHAQGRVASLMGAEGGQSIGCSLDTLRLLHELGVGYLTLTHNQHVPWADAATEPARLGGLSAFGREVVRECQRLGMLVDLSHVSPGTMRDALDVAHAPVIFSHSSAFAVTPHVRNVPDDVLQRLPGNGGVCMVTFVPEFVNDTVRQWTDAVAVEAAERGVDRLDYAGFTAYLRRRMATTRKPEASIADVVGHIEHVREVAGVEHVGLGGDFDGTDSYPVGLTDVAAYPALLAALAERGWSDAELAAVAGGNVLRVMADAAAAAGRLQHERPPSSATFAELDGAAT
ncbi:MAG: dipeptidase [Actinomycetales bacterium]|nr:dipeptidase [Actinomycetales bacterium]